MTMPTLITIERHILEQQKQYPLATGAFTALMYDIALAAKIIARETTRAGLADILGRAGSVNVQGEEQQKLDVFANRMIVQLLDHTGRLGLLASEESAEPIHIPDRYPRGNYVLLFDPLDGSSNIDYNASIGTIFSIFRRVTPKPAECGLPDLLQAGFRQVAAGYIIYGSSTMLVYSAGRGVYGFTLDPSVGEFLLSHDNLRFPDNPQYYSVNHGYEKHWLEGVRRYVQWITGRDEENPWEGMSLRYIGSLVADFHRTLMSGGIFMYPPDTRDPKRPFGKLRLTYETAPLAFIAEGAGGYASDGVNPILNIQPSSLHQRSPLFVGNRHLVEMVEQYIQRHDRDWVESYRQQVTVVPRPASET
jgi:fructose-1,6-bisphosphatase I